MHPYWGNTAVSRGRWKNAAKTTSIQVKNKLKVSLLTQWERTLHGPAQTALSARSRDSTKGKANKRMTNLYRTPWPEMPINDMPAARQIHCLAGVLANSGTKKLRQAIISRDSRHFTFCLPIPSKDTCNSFRVLQIFVTCNFFQALYARCPIWKSLLDKWVR